MNYRHAFHAGNFADVVKHGALLHLLGHATSRPEPLFALDTHAGAGVYDLAAARTGEAAVGIVRALADAALPSALHPLRDAVRRISPGGATTIYPGSPRLIADALRPNDRLVACELQPDEAARLRHALARTPGAKVVEADGYATLAERLPAEAGNTLVLIDPPFERGDEASRAAEAVHATLTRAPAAVICLWAPLKELEAFDALIRAVETAPTPPVVLEVRLRPLRDPTRLNGCALLLFNAPRAIEPALAAIAAWTAETLGEPGGVGRLWRP